MSEDKWEYKVSFKVKDVYIQAKNGSRAIEKAKEMIDNNELRIYIEEVENNER